MKVEERILFISTYVGWQTCPETVPCHLGNPGGREMGLELRGKVLLQVLNSKKRNKQSDALKVKYSNTSKFSFTGKKVAT